MKINDATDRNQLQQDLSKLVIWPERIQFIVSKCKMMHMGWQNPLLNYFMNNQELEQVNLEKDLRVLVTRDLKSSQQCLLAYTARPVVYLE